MTQTELVNEYLRIKAELGRQPSQKEFKNHSHESAKNLQKLYGRNAFSQLVRAAGDAPNQFSRVAKTDDELMTNLACWVRKLGNFPTGPDWLHHKISPSETTYNKRFGATSALPRILLAHLNNSPDWADVVKIIKKTRPVVKPDVITSSEIESEDEFYRQMTQSLELCATQEGKSHQFEKSVAMILNLFGFVVRELGQGTGRNPDGFAYSSKHHIGFLYDAKARKDAYSLGTDDRIFNEYIAMYKKPLLEKGASIPFFLVISSDFSRISPEAVRRVETPIYFIKARQLADLAVLRLKYSVYFEPDDFLRFFSEGNGASLVDDTRLKAFTEEIALKYASA